MLIVSRSEGQRKNMKRWFITYLLVITLAAPWVSVKAQTPLEIEHMQVDIWPEYDKPDILVIYRITISASSTLPAQVSLRIPRIANAPYNVAMKDVDGMLYNLKYDQVVEGDWTRVSFTAASTEIQIEYYDSRIVRDGMLRQFEFYWPGDYRVHTMELRIQQPINAIGMKLTQGALKMSSGIIAEDGLTYYTVPIDGQVEPGTTFRVGFSYTKPDDVLTSSQAPVQPVRTVTSNALAGTSSPTTNNLLLVGGIGIGVLLIVFGIFWYVKQQRLVPANASANRRRHIRQSAETEPKSADGTVYCHQCGKRAGPSDTFCRSCGAKLKT
jgi:hypothetical protein